jgi:peptidylprolyl isomerase
LQKIALGLAALITTLTLSGCASEETDLACEPYKTGSQIELIEVVGGFGEVPLLSFPTPITAETIQSKVLHKGSGNTFTGRNLVEFEFAGYNAGTGDLLQQSSFSGIDPASGFFGPGLVPNFCSALAGVKEGSRVVTLIPALEAHRGEGIPGLGIEPQDAFLFVFDITKVYLEKATGKSQTPASGTPAVVRTPDGIPGVTIPKKDPPTELIISQLIKGEGEIVSEGQKVTLHYSGFLWNDESEFDSSWDTGQPAQFDLVQGGLIPGFISAVVGQPVGSQVIAVIPPELGYGSADMGKIPPGSTLVFVIDILGTKDQ